MVSVVKVNCREHRPLTMISFMKLHPQDHWALESDLITLHVTRLGPKNVHKVGRIEALKHMNQVGPKQCIKWPLHAGLGFRISDTAQKSKISMV